MKLPPPASAFRLPAKKAATQIIKTPMNGSKIS